MMNRIFQPVPILSEIVEHYWYSKLDLNEPVIQNYATPVLQGMVFNLKRFKEYHVYDGKQYELNKPVYIFGQSLSSRIVTSDPNGIDILGVKFKPLGISKITGINMEHLANKIIAAEDFWGKELESLCDEMQSAATLKQSISVLEKFLTHKFIQTNPHYRINHASQAIRLITESKGNISIRELQEQTHTSRKSLERSFINYLGVHPKLYTRIIRFNAAKEIMDKINTDNISLLAFNFGYYDSSHFISEFKHFCGITPIEYLKNKKEQYFSSGKILF